MLSLRYIFRFIQAFLNKFKAIILIGVGLGFIIFLLIVVFIPSFNAEKTRIGLIGRYTTDNLPFEITNLLSSGLTKVEENGYVIPSVAKSWNSADGGKSWVFTLNDNIYWQDGKKLTAKDINYKFSDATTNIINDYEIRFDLDSVFSAFPIIVSKPIFKQGLVGLGEWKVKKLSLSAGIVQNIILKNKNGNINIYKFYPSEEKLKLAYKLGEIDKTINLSNPYPFETWKNSNVTKKVSFDNFVAIFINNEKEKLKDKSIRQALNYSIDKTNFTENRAISPISPFSWGYNPNVKEYKLDLEKTKDLEGLELKLLTFPNLLNIAETIKKDLEKVGVKVTIENSPSIPSDYDLFLATVDIPKDPDQYSLWHSTQEGTNISKFKNARIDKLLEDGRTELDKETRKKIYLDFQRFLVEESPAIFLYHPILYTVSRK